jgi:uncharacterized protein (DUF885 family)
MRLALFAALLASAVPAAAAPAEDLRQLMDEHYAWLLRENPVAATGLGVRDHDDRIGDASAAARDRRAAEAAAFLQRLDAIPAAQLAPADRTNHAILRVGWPRRSRPTATRSVRCCSPLIMAGTRASPAWRAGCRSARARITAPI